MKGECSIPEGHLAVVNVSSSSNMAKKIASTGECSIPEGHLALVNVLSSSNMAKKIASTGECSIPEGHLALKNDKISSNRFMISNFAKTMKATFLTSEK